MVVTVRVEELLARTRGSCVDGTGLKALYPLDGNFKDMSGASGPLAAEQPGPAWAAKQRSRKASTHANVHYLRPGSHFGWAKFSEPQKFCSQASVTLA